MDVLHGLSVGQTSGLIAVGTAFVSFTAPLFIGILFLRWQDRHVSASTWSVLGRQLQSSTWPSLLRTDSVATSHVASGVAWLSQLGTLLSLLTLIAGVITPLGLHDGIAMAGNQDATFLYVPDRSSFGRSTQPRSTMPFSRDCLISGAQCPGAIVDGAPLPDSSKSKPGPGDVTATTLIPKNITTMFTSATDGTTVSSIFDIQYRSWKPTKQVWYDKDRPYLKGTYPPLDDLILREDITLVEGIIADFRTGGIGLRNHTLPNIDDLGAEWTEDVLWIEPEFACVHTNLSFAVTLGENFGALYDESLSAINLVDDGGFARLRAGDPYKDFPDLNYSQPNPRLRAERTAWLHNLLTAMVFNITSTNRENYSTNVTEGTRYPLPIDGYFAMSFTALQPVTDYLQAGTWLNLPSFFEQNGTLVNSSHPPVESYTPSADYPYQYGSFLFDDLDSRCTGQHSSDSNNAFFNVECGYLHGSPIRVDGGSPLEQEAGSSWKVPIYIAIGAVKASIKTVTFSSNGTSSLVDIAVTKVANKEYASEADHPLWATEDWWYSGSAGADLAPLWGVVDNSYDATPGYNFTRAATFYLPGTSWISTWSGTNAPLDSLAGSVAPYAIMAQTLSSAFTSDLGISISTVDHLASYSGVESAALGTKWYELSQTEVGSELMLRLVWTDIMANAVVGTKPHPNLQQQGEDDVGSSSSSSTSSASVTVYARRVTYDLRYAIPALILLTMWSALLLATVVVSALQRYTLADLRRLLNDTSLGRVATRRYDEGAEGGEEDKMPVAATTLGTRAWSENFSHVRFRFGGGGGGSGKSRRENRGQRGDAFTHQNGQDYELVEMHEDESHRQRLESN